MKITAYFNNGRTPETFERVIDYSVSGTMIRIEKGPLKEGPKKSVPRGDEVYLNRETVERMEVTQ